MRVVRSILWGMGMVAAGMLLMGTAVAVFFVALEVAYAAGLGEAGAIAVALLSAPIVPVGVVIGMCEAK